MKTLIPETVLPSWCTGGKLYNGRPVRQIIAREPAQGLKPELALPQLFDAHYRKIVRKFLQMTKTKSTECLITCVASAMLASNASATGYGDGTWRQYSQEPTGDVYFFDASLSVPHSVLPIFQKLSENPSTSHR